MSAYTTTRRENLNARVYFIPTGEVVDAVTVAVATWPDNAKASDAMLNIASSQAELGDLNGARQTLRAVVDKYPKTPAADQARQRLSRR